MTPLEILHDIVIIARAVYTQVELAKNNKKKLHVLMHTMQLLITSLEGLSDLPNNKHFVDSLTAFHGCIKDTQTLVNKITEMGRARRFFYAQSNEEDINHCKQKIIEFIPLLSLGLNAQHLMDRERDRQDALADRQAFVEQKERELREAQAEAKMEQRERDAILMKQLASVRHQLAKQSSPASSPVSPLLLEEFTVNLYDITFDQKVEEGDFGSIYQGTWQDQPVTIKCFDHIATEAERAQLTREAQVMSRLHHETITHFYGACLDQERPCLLTSVLENGTLETALSSLSLAERLMMAKDLARGLAYLHAQSIIHGDIHPKHIGVNQHNEAKWTDFGLAKVRAAGIATLPRVSLEAAWQAPESWQNRAELSPASDVYSFGMLLWTLVTGKFPYAEVSASNIIRLVKRGERETIPREVPKECRYLIEACWAEDVLKRPTATQVAQALKTMPLPTPVVTKLRSASPTGEEYYERGVESQRIGNMVEAYHDYQRAVQKDFFKAYTRVGLFALQGLGGAAVNKAAAQAALETGAARGHGDAMFNLGRMAEKGDTPTGVADDITALAWYEKALKTDPEHPRYQEKVATLKERTRSSAMNAATARLGRK